MPSSPVFSDVEDDLSDAATEGVCASEGFDWGELARGMGEGESGELRALAEELAWGKVRFFVRRLAKYLVEGGKSRVEGAGIRAFVFAWALAPEFQGLSQTELAALINRKHKQSVGREVTKFRDVFGWACERMQSERARAGCRKRERAKRVGAKEGGG